MQTGFKHKKSIDLLFFCCLLDRQTRIILWGWAERTTNHYQRKQECFHMEKPTDSKGNRTGSYFSMLVYYGGDEKSRRVIRSYPLSRCTIVPCVRIIVSKNDARSAEVVLIFPAENYRKRWDLSLAAIESLRCLAKKPRCGWEVENKNDTVEFFRAGCVLPPDEAQRENCAAQRSV